MNGKLLEKITIIILVLLGIISVIISSLDLFFTDFKSIPYLKDTSLITLLLIGILCIAIGLERFSKLEVIHSKIDNLYDVLESVTQPQMLDGRDDIYRAAINLINSAQKVIRASSFRYDHKKAPNSYLAALTNKIETSKKEKKPIEYRLVYGYGDIDKMIKTNNEHIAHFEKKGIIDNLRFKYFRTPIGIDLLIIDNNHLLIALPTLATDPDIRRGLKFVNEPNLVHDICIWYDDYLWRNSTNIIENS